MKHETHIIKTENVELIIFIAECSECINVHHVFKKPPTTEHLEEVKMLAEKALWKWDESPKPSRISTNRSNEVGLVYPHESDVKNGMQVFKDRNKKNEE